MAPLPKEPKSSEITPEARYASRREWLKNAASYAGGSLVLGAGTWWMAGGFKKPRAPRPEPTAFSLAGDGGTKVGAMGDLVVAKRDEYLVNEDLTTFDDVTTYNNYYELGLSKEAPAENASSLKTRPWTVEVGGLVHKPLTFGIDDLLSLFPLEQRVYRFRCVEAWSMVIPWVGFPLKALLDRVEPMGSAKYVAFTTLLDPERLPGQKRSVLDWPYVEGLRLDEALHPLTLLAVGLYGKTLLGQNGAPLRLVVPWKYGFKGIKSIVKVELTDVKPPTTWAQAGPSEYGFYANVNPAVPHPRWSQATERRIGELGRRPTLPFNGYADQVASLYAGLDPSTLY